MENISYGKIVLIGAGHVGSAILDSLLRMNLADEIVVINRNEKKALGVVLDAGHTTAFAYSANANIRVGTYEDCKELLSTLQVPAFSLATPVTAWYCCRPMCR